MYFFWNYELRFGEKCSDANSSISGVFSVFGGPWVYPLPMYLWDYIIFYIYKTNRTGFFTLENLFSKSIMIISIIYVLLLVRQSKIFEIMIVFKGLLLLFLASLIPSISVHASPHLISASALLFTMCLYSSVVILLYLTFNDKSAENK